MAGSKVTTRHAFGAADEDEAGVLLYYSYFAVEDPAALLADLKAASVGLVGRVRCSREGVNATLGGGKAALLAHIDKVRALGVAADFKVDALSDAERRRFEDPTLREQTGFDGLTGRVVDELVTYGTSLSVVADDARATSLPPATIKVGSNEEWDAGVRQGKNTTVVLDVRNEYESDIGHFKNAVRPQIRNTSEIDAWLRRQPASTFAGKTVYAYCTGGVRCERAAQLLGHLYADATVRVLDGGVLGYLARHTEPAPSSWMGRLFVFDPRASVDGTSNSLPDDDLLFDAPCCVGCGEPCDDYVLPASTRRSRCVECRVLVLSCADCRDATELSCDACAAKKAKKRASPQPLLSSGDRWAPDCDAPDLVCDLSAPDDDDEDYSDYSDDDVVYGYGAPYFATDAPYCDPPDCDPPDCDPPDCDAPWDDDYDDYEGQFFDDAGDDGGGGGYYAREAEAEAGLPPVSALLTSLMMEAIRQIDDQHQAAATTAG